MAARAEGDCTVGSAAVNDDDAAPAELVGEQRRDEWRDGAAAGDA